MRSSGSSRPTCKPSVHDSTSSKCVVLVAFSRRIVTHLVIVSCSVRWWCVCRLSSKVVQNDAGLVQHFAWGDNPEKNLQWCAFYSDCEHEVLPVTKGYRVTLTYLPENLDEIPDASTEAKAGLALLLAAQHVAESKVPGLKPTTATLLAGKIQEALRDPEFASNGVKLGFDLTHGYIIGKNGKVPVLKGSDRLLKDDLDRLGLKYACVPVYRSQSYDYSFMINPDSRKRTYWALDFEDEAKLQ